MVSTMSTSTKGGGTLTREQICQYVWARYVDNTTPKVVCDEDEALTFFEDYYAKHPLNEDDECFFYGVLLYERAFSDETNRARYLVKARDVFEVYRKVSGETEWDVIEDRLTDVNDIIKTENLESKVKTAAELAPQIPGMVLIPSGSFPFGPDRKDTHLEPFYIDIYPVTNARYREFLEDTKYRSPRLWDTHPHLADDELPVTGVSWMDALQYCKWSDKSLPTAEQWEKAARGPKGHTYPWGDDEPTPDMANLCPYGHPEALEIPTRYADTPSPYGALSLIGGVWEWTNTSFPGEDGSQAVKGACYVDPPAERFAAAWAVNWASKKEKNELIGFRCAKPLILK